MWSTGSLEVENEAIVQLKIVLGLSEKVRVNPIAFQPTGHPAIETVVRVYS
jgi:hypothetical protein